MSVLGQKRGSFRFDALASLNGVSGYGGQVGAAMDLVELSHKADTPVHELSYGEKRRVEIGLALATGANVLLLDWPFVSISPHMRFHDVRLLEHNRRGRSDSLVIQHMDATIQLSL